MIEHSGVAAQLSGQNAPLFALDKDIIIAP